MPNIRAYEAMLGDALVPNDPKQVIALRASNGDPAVTQLVLAKRAKYKAWVTVTQRQWQTKPKHGPHHDSHSIRERYVRC